MNKTFVFRVILKLITISRKGSQQNDSSIKLRSVAGTGHLRVGAAGISARIIDLE